MGLILDEKMQGDQGPPTCHTLPGLSPGQIRLCQLYMDHMNSVALGARQALTECKHQFQNRRWNCSLLNDVNVFGPVITIGKMFLFTFKKTRCTNTCRESNHSSVKRHYYVL